MAHNRLIASKETLKLRKMKKDQLSPQPFSKRRILKIHQWKELQKRMYQSRVQAKWILLPIYFRSLHWVWLQGFSKDQNYVCWSSMWTEGKLKSYLNVYVYVLANIHFVVPLGVCHVVAVPEGGWFCDEDCCGNTGFGQRGVKKIRMRAHVIEWVNCNVTIVTIKNLTTVIVETMFFQCLNVPEIFSQYVEIMIEISFLGLLVMAKGGEGLVNP